MRHSPLIVVFALAACGVADVGTTAATSAKVAAEQARQSQQDVEAAKAKIDAAMAAEQQRLRDAEAGAGK